MPKKGKFIVFEGIDGSGKSTQIRLLQEKLLAQDHRVHLTHEPTSSPIGSLIRNIINQRIQADEQTIAALFVADRLDHIQNPVDGMLMLLEKGVTVIADRYYFSSYAYQGSAVPLDWVVAANAPCAQLLRADITFYIDISPETSLQRISKNRAVIDLFETQDRQTKVRERYLYAFEHFAEKENIVVIDGERTQEAILEEIWRVVEAS